MDMLNRIAKNRSLVPSKRARFKEDVREGIYSKTHRIRRILDRQDLTPEKKNRALERIRFQMALSRKRDKIIYFTSGLLVMILVLLIYLYLIK